MTALMHWRSRLQAIRQGGASAFEWTEFEGCGFTFSNNKQIAVVLTKTDTLASPPAAPVSQQIVTVVCSSPITVSAGFGFAKLKESNFAFVQSSATDPTTMKPIIVSKLGLTSQSDFRVVPAVLV